MRYTFYGVIGLMLAVAVIMAGGTSAHAAGVGGSGVNVLTENTLILKTHGHSHHHKAKKAKAHGHKHARKPVRRPACPHKRPHTCPHGH